MNAPVKFARYSIDTCSMLVEFNASQWTARKLDKTTTDEVVTSKGAANKGAARVNKHLLAGRSELEVINTHVGTVRQYVYTHTLPWSDAGLRLLPSTSFMEFNQKMADYEDGFYKLVNEFIDVYPTLITAQAMALGDMFNRDDFPSADELKYRFSFRLNYMPVPDAGDFRVDVGNEAQKELQTRLQRLADERIEYAMRDVKSRLKTHLDLMSARLTVIMSDDKVAKGRIHDTLLGTANDLCSMVKALNITNDQDLESARRMLADAIQGVTTDDFREDLHARTEVKTKIDAIRNAFSF